MSVLLETSLGEIVIDLLVDAAPKCCEKYVTAILIHRGLANRAPAS